MSEKRIKHTGDDQLVYGMPKHMVGVAGGEKRPIGNTRRNPMRARSARP